MIKIRTTLLGVTLLLIGGIAFVLVSSGYTLFPFFSIPTIFILVLGGVLTLIGIYLLIYAILFDSQMIDNQLRAHMHDFSRIALYMVVFLVFILSLSGLILSMVFPETFAVSEQSKMHELQILFCIVFAGILGGIVRQLTTSLKPFEHPQPDDLPAPPIYGMPEPSFNRAWRFMSGMIKAIFVSLVIFLLLRAGILKTVTIDTFNIYGVTGLSALGGFLADSIIGKFSKIYQDVTSSP